MRFCCRAVAGLMVITWALPVVVGQPPGAGAPAPGGPAATTVARPQLKIKVFKLERGDPDAVILSLNSLLEEPNADVAAPVPSGASGPGKLGGAVAPQPGGPPSGFGGGVAPPTGGFGFAGVPAPPAGGVGFGGAPVPGGGAIGVGGRPTAGRGNIGCFIGDGGGNGTPVWRAAAQARTRSVVVQGSDHHLSVAADLVAILDRRANAPVPKLQVVRRSP